MRSPLQCMMGHINRQTIEQWTMDPLHCQTHLHIHIFISADDYYCLLISHLFKIQTQTGVASDANNSEDDMKMIYLVLLFNKDQ